MLHVKKRFKYDADFEVSAVVSPEKEVAWAVDDNDDGNDHEVIFNQP